MNPVPLSLSVIICATAKQTWESLTASIGSVLRQSLPATEVILVVDDNPALLERARTVYSHLRVFANSDVRGMSGSRHTGLQAARGEIIAFLEGAEQARPKWLTELVSVYNTATTAVGTRLPLAEARVHLKVS